MEQRQRVAGVVVTNPGRVLWPEEGWTKLDLVRFYDFVFPALRPWMKDRLISLKRCPYGLGGKCFHQKEKPAAMASDTPTKRIVHRNGVRHYVVGGRKETQLALANLGCIAVHLWSARREDPRKPDWVSFDLDPDSGDPADAARGALRLKEALDALRLTSFAKTSGGKGLHVFVPIRVGLDCDEVKAFAESLGAKLAFAYPELFTVEPSIARRRGRVYLDPYRNAWAQTVASPFCARRKPHAPVSTPLSWREVRPDLAPARFTIGNFAARLRKRDPWADFWKVRQDLAPAITAMARL